MGHWTDKFDERDVVYRAAAAAPAELPAEDVSMKNALFAVGPLFQYKRGTCVLQVASLACKLVWEERYGMGKDTPTLSRRAGYYVARSLSGDQHLDDGCYPRFAMQALDDMGFTTEDTVPYDEDLINDPLPAYAYSDMIGQEHVLRYKRIIEGTSAIEDYKHAITMTRRPVGLAIDVVPSFDEYQGGVWMPRNGERSRGSHYIMAIGYSDRLRAFLCTQSWEGFGIVENGCPMIWVSYDVVAQGYARDSYVIYPSALPSSLNTNKVIL